MAKRYKHKRTIRLGSGRRLKLGQYALAWKYVKEAAAEGATSLACDTASASRRCGVPRGAGGVQKKLADIVEEEKAAHPTAVIETFATDEHRIGLKPVLRRIWAPKGQRPVAVGHHRFEWLYVTAFVSPATGESFWYIYNAINKPLFEKMLALFAEEAGAGAGRRIVLVLNNAGWHSEERLDMPDGIRLVHLPPYTPELQPAETLWTHVDEPIANRHFEALDQLDAVVARQCTGLATDKPRIRSQAGFQWWPNRILPN